MCLGECCVCCADILQIRNPIVYINTYIGSFKLKLSCAPCSFNASNHHTNILTNSTIWLLFVAWHIILIACGEAVEIKSCLCTLWSSVILLRLIIRWNAEHFWALGMLKGILLRPWINLMTHAKKCNWLFLFNISSVKTIEMSEFYLSHLPTHHICKSFCLCLTPSISPPLSSRGESRKLYLD